MKKVTIQIKLEYEVDTKFEVEAVDYVNTIELPEHYVENSFTILDVEDVLTPDEISDRICELEQYATRRYIDTIEFKYILETLNDDDKIEYDRLQEQLKNLQTKE